MYVYDTMTNTKCLHILDPIKSNVIKNLRLFNFFINNNSHHLTSNFLQQVRLLNSSENDVNQKNKLISNILKVIRLPNSYDNDVKIYH